MSDCTLSQGSAILRYSARPFCKRIIPAGLVVFIPPHGDVCVCVVGGGSRLSFEYIVPLLPVA